VVEAFTAAVTTTFEELAGAEVFEGEPFVTGSVPPAQGASAAIVLRRKAPGRIVLALAPAALEALATRYLPAETTLTQEILEDLAGEFLNVIAGQAKTMLKGTRYHYFLSPPIVGSAAAADWPTTDEFLAIPFTCDAGPMALYIHLPPSDE
jgi:CheY-specific phosphatase CheX